MSLHDKKHAWARRLLRYEEPCHLIKGHKQHRSHTKSASPPPMYDGAQTAQSPTPQQTVASDPSSSSLSLQRPGSTALLPVYSARKPLSDKDFFHAEAKVEGLMQRALEALHHVESKALPGTLAGGHNPERGDLLPWPAALRALHAPGSVPELELAKMSVAFQELFFLQVRLLLRRQTYLQSMCG